METPRITVHVDYDSLTHEFIAKREIEDCLVLNEQAKNVRIKDTAFFGKFFDTRRAIKDSLIKMVAPDADQWNLTPAAQKRIVELMDFNTDDT